MGARDRHPGPREGALEALHTVLGASFAVQRLSAWSLASFYGSALPSLVLWIHAWHPLPDLVSRSAAVAWLACVALAFALAIVAVRRAIHARTAVPAANRIARVHFASSGDGLGTSVAIFGLSVLSSAALCLHVLAPWTVRPDIVALDCTLWVILLGAAVLSHYFERS